MHHHLLLFSISSCHLCVKFTIVQKLSTKLDIHAHHQKKHLYKTTFFLQNVHTLTASFLPNVEVALHGITT